MKDKVVTQEAAFMPGWREPWQQWQLDTDTAEAYERYLVPRFFEPGAHYLIELAALRAGERVLDVACGTGIVARTAAAHTKGGGRVAGLDLNEGMLEVARKNAAEIHPPIEWRQGDVSALPFEDAAFDVVFCQQGLQFFPDRPAALAEMHRVLAPNGRLALNVLRSVKHNPSYGLLAQVLEQHAGPEAGTMMRSPFPDMHQNELRALIQDAGFRNPRIFIGIGPVRYPSAEEYLRQEVASSPLAGPIASLGDATHAALLHDLKEALQIYTDDNGIVFPTETHLAIAQR